MLNAEPPLDEVIGDLATAFKAVDETHPQGASRSRTYRPGIEPLKEAEAVDKALHYLKQVARLPRYENAAPMPYPNRRQQCDLVMPKEWAIEFKLIRPFGDNGKETEHWSENVLHPYPGNVSAIGDCVKLHRSRFLERRAIVVFGYEHTPPRIDLTVAIRSFEVIAEQVLGVRLSERHCANFDSLIHPVHQQGKVFGWEIWG